MNSPNLRGGRRLPNPWWVAFVCGMATFVDAAATTGVSYALVLFQSPSAGIPGITADQLGYLTGALTAGVAIGALLGGRLGDRYGRRKVFIITMAFIVLGSITPMVGLDFPVMLAGIILIGLGVGADLPVALATISEAASDRNRGKLIVFSNLLGGFGILMAVLLGIFFGSSGPLGGQIMFGAFGIVGLIVLLLRLTLPESASWVAARAERTSGVQTVRAERDQLRDFGRKPYRRPFVTLIVYYSLAAMAVSVASSFGAYVAVNVTGASIVDYSTWSLLAMPLAIIAALWFMSVADTRYRMHYYIIGSIAVVVANMVPVIFGFSFASLIASILATTFFGAFCFETIMKVWTQESFPTMLRGTAQGSIYFVSRLLTAALNVVTPALLAFNPSFVYTGVSALAAVGFFAGWLGFRKITRNEFDVEAELVAEVDTAGDLIAEPAETLA